MMPSDPGPCLGSGMPTLGENIRAAIARVLTVAELMGI